MYIFIFEWQEQIEWAVDAGADFIVAETFSKFGEALIATRACKEFAKGWLQHMYLQ